MEADVVRWLQCLRHTVAEELEPWNLFSVYRDSVLDSTIDSLFDFDSTTSASDFEYYRMDRQPDDPDDSVSFADNNDGILPHSTSATFPNHEICISFRPKWCDIMAWKNELMDSALDGISSEDEQVLSTHSV